MKKSKGERLRWSKKSYIEKINLSKVKGFRKRTKEELEKSRNKNYNYLIP